MDCAHSLAVGPSYELAQKNRSNGNLCSRWLVGTSYTSLGPFADFSCSVCTTGVARVVYIEKLVFNDITCTISYTLSPSRFDNSSTPGSSVYLQLWTNVESGIGIVCTCLPILRPLFCLILPRSFLARFSHDSADDDPYKLTNLSHIRGKLKRIPSNDDGVNKPDSQNNT